MEIPAKSKTREPRATGFSRWCINGENQGATLPATIDYTFYCGARVLHAQGATLRAIPSTPKNLTKKDINIDIMRFTILVIPFHCHNEK